MKQYLKVKKGTGLNELLGYAYIAISASSTRYNNDLHVNYYKPGGHHKGGLSITVGKVNIPRYSARSIFK